MKLEQLEQQVRCDLACLNYPPANWVPAASARGAPAASAPDGASLLDVLIVGAGMCGQTAAFALRREGVANVRIIDRAQRGDEGPWATFARMETLRSPKQLTGPDLGIPSLTFRRWYEAQHGAAGWEALYKIPRVIWRDYLLWLRDVLELPVENGFELLLLQPRSDCVAARVRGPRGTETVLARRVVLAAGRDGAGALRWPRFPSFDPRSAQTGHAPDHVLDRTLDRVFHASADIDFSSFVDRRIAVLGVGATAFDNAATALEAGAATVTMFARRRFLPQVNKSKWASFPGFQHGFAQADDATRWRFLTYINDEQVPPPHESVLRCDRHPGFRLRLGEPWRDVRVQPHAMEVITDQATYLFDALILATGFDVDLNERSELAAVRESILLWRDRVSAEQAQQHPEESRFPYLGAGFELQPRAGSTTALSRIHVFNWGSTMSHGPIAGDIPGLRVAAERLARAITGALFLECRDQLFEAMQGFDEPELQPTRWFVPPGQR